MNIKDDILNTLESKGYDDFTKIRWIYLYVCEMFSYDTRFYFAGQDMKEKIYNSEVNLSNVEEFEFVCYTISRVLVDILTELGYDALLIKDGSNQFSHAYVEVKFNDHILKLDPTKRHDITRMKMNSTTLDFDTGQKDDCFSDRLLETDKNIAGDFNGLYFSDKSVIKRTERFLQELEIEAKEKKLSKEEVFFRKIDTLNGMINSRTDLKRYDDIDFYYSYLLRALKINKKEYWAGGKIALEDYPYVKPVVLFNKDDKSMKDIINISFVQYEKLPPIFYLLKKEGDNFIVREIFKDEAIEILKQYHCPFNRCQFMLEDAVKRLSSGNKNGIIL